MQHVRPRIRVGRSLLGDLWRATCACGDAFQDPSQHELRIWTASHARACPVLSAAARDEASRELRALTPDLDDLTPEHSGVAFVLRRLAHR